MAFSLCFWVLASGSFVFLDMVEAIVLLSEVFELWLAKIICWCFCLAFTS